MAPVPKPPSPAPAPPPPVAAPPPVPPAPKVQVLPLLMQRCISHLSPQLCSHKLTRLCSLLLSRFSTVSSIDVWGTLVSPATLCTNMAHSFKLRAFACPAGPVSAAASARRPWAGLRRLRGAPCAFACACEPAYRQASRRARRAQGGEQQVLSRTAQAAYSALTQTLCAGAG